MAVRLRRPTTPTFGNAMSNYQRLSNADIPVGVFVEIYDCRYDSIKFAERLPRRGEIVLRDGYVRKRLTGWEELHKYADFKKEHGNDIYWAPIENPKDDKMPWIKSDPSVISHVKELLDGYKHQLKKEIDYRKSYARSARDNALVKRAECELKSLESCVTKLDSFN